MVPPTCPNPYIPLQRILAMRFRNPLPCWMLVLLVLLVAASGCTGSSSNQTQSEPNPEAPEQPNAPQTEPPVSSASTADVEASLVETWRSYSETRNLRRIEVKADKTWSYGSSSGTWRVEPILEGDWEAWGLPPNQDAGYDPRLKMVLVGWNNGTFSGPILEGPVGVDFFYVVYQAGPFIGGNTAWYIKFGRMRPLPLPA